MQPSTRKATPEEQAAWRLLTPRPCSRSFIVGSVGSGKSTLGCALLASYRSFHPSHRIFILDPKHRFFPVDSQPNMAMFPHGFTATNHGRADGVTVTARLLHEVDGYKFKNERVFVIQDQNKMLEALHHAFTHHDVRQPTLFYGDETVDLIRGFNAVIPLKRAIQMGRELGIGVMLVNQLARHIPTIFMSEAERFYIGQQHHIEDRKRLAAMVSIPDPKRILEGMPRHWFWMIDQIHPSKSRKFTLKEPT